MQSILGQFTGVGAGLVSQAPALLNKFVQQTMGHIHIAVSLLVRQKRNISFLQTVLKQEEESIRDFTRRFGQTVQQIESYNMDAVLQNFRRRFEPSTPFFQSLSLNPPTTMEELYIRADTYSMLEDNIHAATQTIMIMNQLAEGNKPPGKQSSESKEGQNKDRK